MANDPGRARRIVRRIPGQVEPLVINSGDITQTASTPGSTQVPQYGRADVKVYPINEDQLSDLGNLQGIASVSLAVSGTLFGFGINVFKDLQINSGTPLDVGVRWQTISEGSLALAVFFFLIAVIYFVKGHSKLKAIKARTNFK